MSSVIQPQDSFLDQAELAAKHSVCEWILKTLNEVFLQALPQAWTVLPNHKIELPAARLEDCVDAVERVALLWCEKLRDAEYVSVAEWVQEVFLKGKNTLWVELENVTKPAEGQEVDCNRDETAESTGDPNQDPTTKDSHMGSSEEDSVKIPYCELRKLGQKPLGKPPLSSKDALKHLKEMGRRGESYWPLEYKLVDNAAEAIPKRLRCEKSGPAPYQVIPKSVWEKKRQAQQSDAEETKEDLVEDQRVPTQAQTTDASQDLLSAVLERRRKNFGRASGSAAHQLGRKRARPTENSRPASDISVSVHTVNEELSACEKQSLDSLLHDEENDTSGDQTQPFALFGALKQVGDIHHKLQENDPVQPDQSEKQARRQQRAFIQERLNPHRIEKNNDPQRYRSKILKTEDWHDDSKKHFDLDLGWSLMEVRSGQNKRLCAFSSIEIALRDNEDNDDRTTTADTLM